ncbi:MAG TPA: hypothetical protein VIS06_06465, partial [Mycobacteriales bacterium]
AGVQLEYRWQPRGDAAALSRRGVPVVRTLTPAADHAVASTPAGHRWLYGLATLVLLVLAVAVGVLSVH